nr:putative ribonuclease H-like domain-containing protein [Tanacetum cinerariifolium]
MECVTVPAEKPKVLTLGVKCATSASESKPKSNTKKDKTLPAKSSMKKVEDHPRNNNSSVKQKNQVDSSISYKRTVNNLNSDSVCKSCNKCLMYFNHDKCGLKSLKFVKKPPVNKDPNRNWDPTYQTLHIRLFSNAGRTDRPLVFRLRDVNGVGLIKGNHGTNLYTISVKDMMKSSAICLLSKASKNKSLLWHRWFTWVKFLRLKDETLEFVIKFMKQIQVILNKTVRYIRTDNGTKFVNQVLTEYYEGVGIFHQKSVPRTPQQNDVVKRQNRTLVEVVRTMLIFSKAPMFLWAEAITTACYT